MKIRKRTISLILFFIMLAVGLFILQNNKNIFFPPQQETVRSKVVTPIVPGKQTTEADTNLVVDEVQLQSLIPLKNGETLLNVLNMDINSDSFDDQINAIKKADSPCIFLIIGVYEVTTGKYQRIIEIDTQITQVKSFSYTLMDLVGNHSNSLVYWGMSDMNLSVLRAFLPQQEGISFKLQEIVHLEGDGAIFIQQLQRSDAYSLSQTAGEAFPIWIYTSDANTSSQNIDQIQSMYNWNPNKGTYEKTSESRVTGQRLAEKELERIQDGNPDTFKNFLSGLWYKPASGKTIQYIFFNPDNDEIIFMESGTQEVYVWQSNTLRRNGMYVSSVNKSILNLVRRFDIALVSVDEVRIRVTDDVKMVIGEETLWDGTYKRLTVEASLAGTAKQTSKSLLDKISSAENPWISNENLSVFFKENQYSVSSLDTIDTGRMSIKQLGKADIIQFKSYSSNANNHPFFTGYYKVAFDSITEKKITIETLTLTPVTVSVSNWYGTGKEPIVLKRTIK